MRLLHTSDWHIGVKKNRIDRTQDHDHVFDQIKRIARDEKVDAILNTGDLFDERNPSAETILYGWNVLAEMAQIAPVVVLCGNHDSAKYFQIFDEISNARLPIFFVHPANLNQKRAKSIISIPTRANEYLKIGAVPFIRTQTYVRDYIENNAERATAKYADEVGNLEQTVGRWLSAGYDPNRDIRVFAAHLMVDGAQVSGSERQMHVDTDFATKSDRIPTCEYAAFGHIHKPQSIAGIEHGRYAGSPIPIDFGEVNDQKVCYLVSGSPGRMLDIEEQPLDVGRKMIDIRGTLDEISAARDHYKNTIARVFVTLHAPIADLESQVRDILTETIVCSTKGQYARTDDSADARSTVGPEPTLNEMFATFLASDANVAEPDRVQRYFNDLLHRVESQDVDTNEFADIDEVVG